MKSYREAFLTSVIFISLPSAFLFVVGTVNLSASRILFWGGMLALWWCAYWSLKRGTKRSFGITFILINVCWWPLLARTVQRVLFVLENGGMDGADGYGSPVAFLIGVVGEQAFFLPLTVTLFLGCMVLMRSNKQLEATGQGGVKPPRVMTEAGLQPKDAAVRRLGARAIFVRWEQLRLIYNALLIVLVLLATPYASAYVSADLFGDPVFWYLLITGAIGANLCYFAGPAAETYLAWLGLRHLGIRFTLFVVGTLFALGLAFGMILGFNMGGFD